jgi:hypothetical protein
VAKNLHKILRTSFLEEFNPGILKSYIKSFVAKFLPFTVEALSSTVVSSTLPLDEKFES